MATLEKIRSKSVFLLVIIGLALLAFILTDFLTSGRTLFGTGTTVAKVDGQSIDVTDLQRRMQEASETMQQRGQKVDQAELQAMVLNQMVEEALFEKEAKALGLTVTDAELQKFMMGDGARFLDQQVQQSVGVPSVADLYDMLANAPKYGLDQATAAQLASYARKLEDETSKNLLRAKFANLFAGTLVANELDAKAMFDDNAQTATVAFARQDLSTLPDDQFAVTDAELQAEYDRERNRYQLDEETRTVNFIAVNISPSDTDRDAAMRKLEAAIAGLNSQEGDEAVRSSSDFVVSNTTVPVAKVTDQRLKAFVDTVAVGRAALVSQAGNDYKIAKLLSRAQQVDEVKVDFLPIQGRAQLDSVLTALKAGTMTFAEAKAHPAAGQSADSLQLSLSSSEAAQLRDMLLAANIGEFFTPDSVGTDGGRIFRVVSRGAAEPVVTYVMAEYTIEPSNATINSLMADLSKYVSENNTAEAFAANAVKAGYALMPASVTPSSPSIGGLSDTRGAVRWVMKEAKKGQVSDVMGGEQAGRFLVVAVNDIYTGDFLPVTAEQVKEELTAKVMAQKKGQSLVEKYAGKAKDLAGYATLMGVSVDTTKVNFGRGMGMGEGRLAARIATAKPGEVVAPVPASTSVVAFEVTSVDTNAQPYDFESAATRYNSSRGGQAMMRNIGAILKGRSKVTNNSLTFFGGE